MLFGKRTERFRIKSFVDNMFHLFSHFGIVTIADCLNDEIPERTITKRQLA